MFDPKLHDDARRLAAAADDAIAELHGSEGPPCPGCGHTVSRVLSSRSPRVRDEFKRRRQCVACLDRFTTYEAAKKIA